MSVCLYVCRGDRGNLGHFFVFMLPFHFKITEIVINGFKLNFIPSFVIKQIFKKKEPKSAFLLKKRNILEVKRPMSPQGRGDLSHSPGILWSLEKIII